MRRWPTICPLELFSKCDTAKWNKFLDECVKDMNLTALEKTMYGLQAGMTDLSKKKLNTPEIVNWFLRIERSIEKTIKIIVRNKIKNPTYNLKPKEKADKKALEEKRKIDQAIEAHLRRSSF